MNLSGLNETERFILSCAVEELGLSKICSFEQALPVFQDAALVGFFFLDHIICVKRNHDLEFSEKTTTVLGDK